MTRHVVDLAELDRRLTPLILRQTTAAGSVRLLQREP